MATDSAPTDPESRRELERKAFARPLNKEEQAASADALRQLAALDSAAVPSVPEVLEGVEGPPPNRVAVPEPVEGAAPNDFPFDDNDLDELHPTSRPHSLIPLLVIIGLVVGIGGGVAIARFAPSSSPAASLSTSSPTPTPTTPPLGNATTAISELKTPQTPADKFTDPDFATSLDLESDSIHRILTTSDGITLWVGRSPQAICMLYTGGQEPTGGTGGATCASIFEFGDSGLSLRYGRDLWTWDGISFTTTIEY